MFSNVSSPNSGAVHMEYRMNKYRVIFMVEVDIVAIDPTHALNMVDEAFSWPKQPDQMKSFTLIGMTAIDEEALSTSIDII